MLTEMEINWTCPRFLHARWSLASFCRCWCMPSNKRWMKVKYRVRGRPAFLLPWGGWSRAYRLVVPYLWDVVCGTGISTVWTYHRWREPSSLSCHNCWYLGLDPCVWYSALFGSMKWYRHLSYCRFLDVSLKIHSHAEVWLRRWC